MTAFRLTRVQAEAIGALRLIQLVGLEIEKLVSDYTEAARERSSDYEGDPRRRRAGAQHDPRGLPGDPREDTRSTAPQTSIEDAESRIDFDMGDLIARTPVSWSRSRISGYVKRVVRATPTASRGAADVGIKGSQAKDGDFIEHLFVSSTHDDASVLHEHRPRLPQEGVFEIPEMSRTSKGRAIINLLELREEERIVAFQPIEDFEKSEDYLFFGTSSGRVKRTSLKDYRNVNRTGIIAINLNDGDRLIDVVLSTGQDHVLLSTAKGMAIRFDENDARVMGRNAAGVKGIGLASDDEVIGLVRVIQGADLLTVTENGYGKRTALAEYLVQSEDGARPQNRGGKGRLDIRTTDRNGRVVDVLCVTEEHSLMFVSSGGMIVRVAASDISRIGRNTQGVRVVNLKSGDKLISAGRVMDSDDEGDDVDSPAPNAADGASESPNDSGGEDPGNTA